MSHDQEVLSGRCWGTLVSAKRVPGGCLKCVDSRTCAQLPESSLDDIAKLPPSSSQNANERHGIIEPLINLAKERLDEIAIMLLSSWRYCSDACAGTTPDRAKTYTLHYLMTLRMPGAEYISNCRWPFRIMYSTAPKSFLSTFICCLNSELCRWKD